jgi:amino acid adenylation domain-containing protein
MKIVVDRVRAVAEKSSRRVAVRAPEGKTAFGALMGRVDALAAALADHGVGPGARVGVLLERSTELVTAVLGVMASGAAYVPLDPDYPAERIRYVLEDSGATVLLAQPAMVEALGLQASGRTVLAPSEWPTRVKRRPRVRHAPDDPAYLIYTSGSTGQPKGVVIGHEALENYLAWCDGALPATGGGVPLFASIAFDHSVTCLFPPLRWGEPLTLLPPLRGGSALASGLLTGHHYSFVKITPSHLRMLDRDQRAELGRSCDLVMMGGERVTADLVNHLRRDAPKLAVMNHYGPTEATVGCCTWMVPEGPATDPVPIGRPIPGMQVSVRNAERKPCAEGETGELYLGGVGLAAGYWNKPGLTEAAFVELREGRKPAMRWYRTGDLVRPRPDGALEYLGRIDRQVKILGHRVEPLEIERVLRTHPQIEDTAVIPVEGPEGVQLLAAVVTRQPVSAEDIAAHLRTRLPSALVPAHLLAVDRIPATVHGKIDAERLLALLRDRPGAPREAPRLDEAGVADRLCEHWRGLLKVTQVRPDDDFFELGGDSMASLAVLEWIREQLQVKLELPALFDHPTPRGLAQVILAARRAAS